MDGLSNVLNNLHLSDGLAASDKAQEAGGPAGPRFSCTLCNRHRLTGAKQLAAHLAGKPHRDRAAAGSLGASGPKCLGNAEKKVQRAEALVGDAVLDLLLALLAHERGLQVGPIDALRQRMLSNEALGGCTSGKARADAVEAVVGRAVLQLGLDKVLRKSLSDA